MVLRFHDLLRKPFSNWNFPGVMTKADKTAIVQLTAMFGRFNMLTVLGYTEM